MKGKLEVLVATMQQEDFGKIQKMNLHSDVFFANQGNEYCYQEKLFENHYKARMLTTPERGVGKNRNKALLYAEGEILLFADDDMRYEDDYAEKVAAAYEEIPEADMIIFSCRLSKNGQVYLVIQNETKRLRLLHALKYGTCVISIKKSSIEKANIWFSHLFGGGAPYSAGEDSLFIRECFRKGLKIYTHKYMLGDCSKDNSSWFNGYHSKYFFDKGVLYGVLFPKISLLVCGYFLMKHNEQTREIGTKAAWKEMKAGVQAWKTRDM